MIENNASMNSPISSLSSLLSEESLDLLRATGNNLIEATGMDVIRAVVFDVLTGRNIRSSTESITRRRIASLNLALVELFLNGREKDPDFVKNLPYIASDILSGRSNNTEKWLANWAIGLTGKGVQNILRNDPSLVPGYRDVYIEVCNKAIAEKIDSCGELSGTIFLETSGKERRLEVDWLFLLYLLNMVGSETLTIRGSEKSLYGKFFEKLVLGALLHILGFTHIPTQSIEKPRRAFWLSSNTDGGRESDATILYEPGQGIRIDIGFIGSGNTEISLDKVSRYRREIEIGSQNWFMGTIIIVDRIGPRSQIPELAEEIGGTIVQMSTGYWPKRIAATLNSSVGFDHPLLSMDGDDIAAYLEAKLADVPLADFIQSATGGKVIVEEDEENSL